MTAGILQLNAQEGDEAQDLEDQSAYSTARRQVANIETKAQNKAAIWNLVGRGVAAGTATKMDVENQNVLDKDGNPIAQPGVGDVSKDFAQNFANPYAKYKGLNAHARAQVSDPNAVGPPIALMNDPQPGSISSITNENAPVVGSIISGMMGPVG